MLLEMLLGNRSATKMQTIGKQPAMSETPVFTAFVKHRPTTRNLYPATVGMQYQVEAGQRTGLLLVPIPKRGLAPRRATSRIPRGALRGACPRQSGKTTLLRSLFGGTYAYVSLEPPDIRASATADPRGFLAHYPPPVIFDEVQSGPPRGM